MQKPDTTITMFIFKQLLDAMSDGN